MPISTIAESKKERGIGIGFYINTRGDGDYLEVYALNGILCKENKHLHTKIEKIEENDYFVNPFNLKQDELEIVKETLKLSLGIKKIYRKGADKKIRHILNELHHFLPKENQRIYLLKDNYRISRNTISPLNIIKNKVDLSFEITEERDYFLFKSYLLINGSKLQLLNKKFGNNLLFIKHKNDYYLSKSLHFVKTLAVFIDNPEIRIRKSEYENYYNEFIKPLSSKYQVKMKFLKIKKQKLKTSELKKQLYLSELSGFILIKPVLEYHKKHIYVLENEVIYETIGEENYELIRDEKFENSFIEELKKFHPNFQEQTQSFFYLTKDEFIENTWFLDFFENTSNQNIEVFGFENLPKLKYNINKPTVSVNINSQTDWFDVDMKIAFGNIQVSLRDVRKSILNKDKYVKLSDGTIGILPEEWLKKYTHLFRAGDVKKDSITVSKYQFSVIDSLYKELDQDIDLVKNHLKIKQKFKDFNKIEKVKVPAGIKATLRDYQLEGLNWLGFLDEFNFGGCLADDMGLGKTLQIITFLQYLKKTKKTKEKHLIIVPTSLIFNWNEEVKKFAPALKIKTLTGIDRTKNTKDFNKYDIILTTYGVILRDVDYLKEYKFGYIILDESQAIKNPNSKRFKAVRVLKSRNKLVLTGTPIENNTFDLYAQMTFVNPGLLGNMSHFKKEFSTPIDKLKDNKIAQELTKVIKPFLLRRTKEQVAKELPPKVEQILYCTMETEQQKLYDAYRNKYRDFLLNKIEEDGIGKSKMYVLEGLIKLRQICDSPQLLNDEEKYTDESIKIKELINHVTEKTGNHKILIFSQFVKMLTLIKTELDKNKIVYEYLDGKTKDRQKRVDNFQNNKNVRVFLISLKAGGTGLNLTEADYVYLVDPWWNPAVEAQAIDRCYRIGQDKNVMAYKMICKGTIEEKIIQHQLNKKQVSDNIIQTDESFVKALSKDSIADLFS